MALIIFKSHFRCDDCNRHFTQKIHLRKHLEKHHPDSIYDYKETCDALVKVEDFPENESTKGIIYEEYELVEEASEVK